MSSRPIEMRSGRVLSTLRAVALAASSLVVLAASQAAAAEELKKVKVVFIQHCCSGATFFQPMQFGAEEAARLFQVELNYVNADGDAARAANLIETAIADKADAVLPTITVPDALDAAIKKAREAGLVVIAQNIDDPDHGKGNARQAFVGQNFITSGKIIGERMIKEHGLKAGDHCLLPVEFPELTYGVERAQGVQSALKPAGITSEVIGTGTVDGEALNTISQAILANPKISCIIGLGQTPTNVAVAAAEEAGRAGIPNGGFDTGADIIPHIIDGKTTATMDQQPFWQGFLPVMFAAYAVRYGLTPPDIDTGNNLIDKSNADLAKQFTGTYR